ncbi:MAG: glycosyltransferase [Bacteroidia bacterium]|nr:glycosyltransferase [Bacteroidia bacterium]
MKILLVNSSANMGSTGRISEQIGLKVIQEGWESFVAYGRKANSSKSKLFRIGTNFEIYKHLFFSRIFGKHGLSSVTPTEKLIKYIQEIKPDIIHLHNLHGYYINYKILFESLSKLQKCKIVWTLHDCWSFTGHCTYFSDINCDRWKTQCFDCPKKNNYPSSFFFDRSFESYQLKKELFTSFPITIVPVSNWLGDLVKESFLSCHNIEVILNGVDSEIFCPKEPNTELLRKYQLQGKTILLAASTSWAGQKGFNDYIELSKVINKNLVIVLVGLPRKLMFGLPTNVIGVPRTENVNELVDWYNLASVVLNLSKLETFGLTSVEGFMCGKPSIVYNATASPELIKNDNLGRIVSIGDIQGVSTAIGELLSSSNSKEIIRKSALLHFDVKVQLNKYIYLYKSILES